MGTQSTWVLDKIVTEYIRSNEQIDSMLISNGIIVKKSERKTPMVKCGIIVHGEYTINKLVHYKNHQDKIHGSRRISDQVMTPSSKIHKHKSYSIYCMSHK